jgi:hypothetical protein
MNAPGCDHVSLEPRPTEVVDMCHDWWMRRERRRQEQFDDELRYLLDEERRRPVPPTPVVEHEPDEEPADPKGPPVEAATRS